MAYIPHTQEQQQQMLAALCCESVEQLFAEQIPAALRLRRALDVPPQMSEIELRRHFAALAGANRPATEQICFLGAGIYDHYVPSVVGSVISRGEFYTAYTPYQAEMSQGTLQTIFEFQTMICNLTGLDVANASMYDGATALAEAIIMACDLAGRDEVLLPAALHPAWKRVARTYTAGLGIRLLEVPWRDGIPPVESVRERLGARTAGVVVQQPNFLGCVADLRALGEAAHAVGALLVVAADPIALGLLATTGAEGADICVGEGQPLGLGMNYGGPLLGLFATRQQFVRRMPGRLVGKTHDRDGRPGYVLTLQTREQHIRRERATSNICTNQGLMMLAATVYLSVMGRQGLREVATQCLRKAHYAAERIAALPGYRLAFGAPFFKEFVVRCPRPAAEIVAALAERGILAGYDLGRDFPNLADHLLIAVTEQRTREEIDCLAEALDEAANGRG
ncbi:MAG: aminomethyl-transferring glycine dehydrogenase subunit GcvPA [Armatimonadetes bacterium]|nr:aminomethyl-transferring glycine dehydrogenase subunit GcvPA [Armatimonadota bacterium]